MKTAREMREYQQEEIKLRVDEETESILKSLEDTIKRNPFFNQFVMNDWPSPKAQERLEFLGYSVIRDYTEHNDEEHRVTYIRWYKI